MTGPQAVHIQPIIETFSGLNPRMKAVNTLQFGVCTFIQRHLERAHDEQTSFHGELDPSSTPWPKQVRFQDVE